MESATEILIRELGICSASCRVPLEQMTAARTHCILSHPLCNSYMLVGMDAYKTALERAFELARSGTCLSISDIAHKLHSERYTVEQLEGSSLKKQLIALIQEVKKPHAKRP